MLAGLRLSSFQADVLAGARGEQSLSAAWGGPWKGQLGWALQAMAWRTPDFYASARDASMLSLAQVALAGAASVPRLALDLGAALRAQTVEPGSQAGLLADLGLRWLSPLPGLRLALAMRGAPVLGSAGGSALPDAALGAAWERGRLDLAAELLLRPGEPGLARSGAEWRPLPKLSLRAGVTSPERGGGPWSLSAGFGVPLSGLDIDIAAASQDGGAALRAGLRLNRDGLPAARPPRLREEAPAKAKARQIQLRVHVTGRHVRLDWLDSGGPPPAGGGYEVLVGLVEGSPMRPLNAGLLASPGWDAQLDLAGVPHYFRVRLVGGDGRALAASNVAAAQARQEEAP